MGIQLVIDTSVGPHFRHVRRWRFDHTSLGLSLNLSTSHCSSCLILVFFLPSGAYLTHFHTISCSDLMIYSPQSQESPQFSPLHQALWIVSLSKSHPLRLFITLYPGAHFVSWCLFNLFNHHFLPWSYDLQPSILRIFSIQSILSSTLDSVPVHILPITLYPGVHFASWCIFTHFNHHFLPWYCDLQFSIPGLSSFHQVL